ncbi:RICIN domain-containing protein [Streptomyces sp. NPDC093970]|uniref:RICIN domain-containing protein n=1 Tax=Streptomyces sp. NPDC093970 TaxID=3155076 RepID=UPI00341C2AD6
MGDPAGELTPHPGASASGPPAGTDGSEHTARTPLSEETPSHDPAGPEESGGWLAATFGSRSRRGGARQDGSSDDADSPGADLREEETPPTPLLRNRAVLTAAALGGALLIALPLMTHDSSDDGRPTAGSARGHVRADTKLDFSEPSPEASDSAAAGHHRSPSGTHGGRTGTRTGTPPPTAGHGLTSVSTTKPTPKSKPKSKPKPSSTPKPSARALSGTTIVGFGSGRCISAGSGKDGKQLVISTCSTTAADQRWTIGSDGTVRSMGLCMDAAGAGTYDGTVVQLAVCNGGEAQHFVLNTSYDLVNVNAHKCVDVTDHGTASGSPLQLWDCNGKSGQKWRRSS